jgi:glycosyltransferase involved in cell wall biosynthesis
VVTDLGESSAIVGETGVVVPPRDPQALADGMMRMLDRVAAEPALSNAARARIESRYSIASVAGHYETLYRSLALPGQTPGVPACAG